MVYRFDDFEALPIRAELRSRDLHIPLRHKSFELLTYLLENHHRVVHRDELLRELWPGAAVTENSVAQCVAELRKALGDETEPRRFIRTFGRAGYKFVAPVERLASAPPVVSRSPAQGASDTTVDQTATEPHHFQGRYLWVALAIAGVVTAAVTSRTFLPGDTRPERAAEPGGLATTSLPAARAYSAAVEHSRNYRPAQAIEQLELALRLDPDFIMARARIGFVYRVRWLWEEKGRPYLESAFAERAKLNELNRLYILAWYNQAHHDYEGAIRNYRALLAKYPFESEAREELGRTLLGENRYNEAREQLEEAIRRDPASAQSHNFLSALHLARHDFTRAIAEAKEFVRLLPGDVNALDTLGLAYELANDFAAAEQTYRDVLARQPGFGSRIHLANTLFKMGHWSQAKREIEAYIHNAPSEAERLWGYDQLAVIALRERNPAEVLRLARLQTPAGYHDQEILLALGAGDLTAADRLLAVRPQHADRGQRANRRLELYVRGNRALAGGDSARAIRLLAQATTERTPVYAIDWYEDCLAAAYGKMGRYPEAIAEYRRVLSIYPRLALAWHGLAKVLEASGKPGQAREAFRKVAEIWKEGENDIAELAEARAASLTPPSEAQGRSRVFTSEGKWVEPGSPVAGPVR